MRQAIKGDGSDGTAALKEYLLANDNVLSQELYEFIRPAIGLSPAPLPAAPANESPTTSDSFVVNADGTGFPTYGAYTISPDGGTLSRSHSRPWWAYYAPGDLYWSGAIGLYGAPGSDSGLAPPRANISKIEAVMDVFLHPSSNGGYVPLYAIEVSVNGGSSYHSLGSPTALASVELALDITSLVGTIASYDFNQIKFHARQGSSTFVDVSDAAVLTFSNIRLRFTFTSSEPPPAPTSSLLTRVCDASSDLTYAGNAYKAAVIKNSGFKSKVGLDVDSLTLEWSFRGDEALVTDPGTGATILTMLQGFQQGLFEGVWVRWRRAYMPTFGDCDTLGAVSSFRGRIAEVEVDRLTAKITVNSVTELFNRQLPQQLIEANNRSMQVGPGLPPDLDPNPSSWTYFEAVPGHDGTVQKIIAEQTLPEAGDVYAPGTFDMGYLWFQASPLENVIVQVHHSEVTSDGFNVFYLFRPLYVDPHAYGSVFAAFVPVPKDQDISGSTGVALKGFKYVPLPEQAV